MKFALSTNQKINLARKGLIYQNGKAVFDKETSQELTKTIQEALNKKHLKKETNFVSIDCDLVKQEQENFKKFKQEQKTIFADNKSFADVLFEGLIFAFGSCVFLTITAGLLIAFLNLLNY